MDANAMQVNLDDALRAIAVQGSYGASRALSKWVSRPVRVHTEGFLQLPLGEFGDVSGSAEQVLTAAHMVLEGDLEGDVLLAMPETDGMQLVDMLTRAPAGTTQSFGELEQSCLKETANIVGSAFTNALASWLEVTAIPAAPTFVHDLGCAIIQPLLLNQALVMDSAWLNKVTFEIEDRELDWSLMLFPNAVALDVIQRHCTDGAPRRNALQAVSINTAYYAGQHLSAEYERPIAIATEGFQVMNAATLLDEQDADAPRWCGRLEMHGDLRGAILLTLPPETQAAVEQELGDAGLASLTRAIAGALQATTNSWLQRELQFDTERLESTTEGSVRRVLRTFHEQRAEILRAALSIRVGSNWHDADFYVVAESGSLAV